MELWSNYKIATGRFFNLPPPCTLSTGDAVRRRRPPGRTGAEPQAQTTSCAPGLPKTAPSWHHLGSPRAPAICALATATAGRAATAVRASPGRPFPSKLAPSSPYLSLPPIKRAPSPLARPDPISSFAARHCRRQARARRGQAIPEPHCLFGRHQNLPRLSLVLYTRSNAAGTLRNMDAGEQSRRRPPLTADPPPQTLSRQATAT